MVGQYFSSVKLI